MDIKKVYKRIKKNYEKPLQELIGDNLNNKDKNGNTLLHLAVQSNDIETVKKLLKEGIIYNSKNNNGKQPGDITDVQEIKDFIQTSKLFFRLVKTGNFHELSKYVRQKKFLINVKEEGGFSLLHWAANNCHGDVIKLLLDNGANVFQYTDKGNTPLHIAVSKKDIGITQQLLKNVTPHKLLEFVNFYTYGRKSTCLHISAENGCFEIVKLLLKYGAVYNFKNKFNNTPLSVCETENIKMVLKVIDNFFIYAENGDFRLIEELNQLEISEFEAVTNARNYIHYTLLQVLASQNHNTVAEKLILLIKKKKEKSENPLWTLKELQHLESRAYSLYSSSTINLILLREKCFSDAHDDNNSCPPDTLGEGMYYLEKIYKLLSMYKEYRARLNDDKNILMIETALKKLEFDPNDKSFDTDNGICNASKVESKYYYKLLHSTSMSDVRQFLLIAEHNIDMPAKGLMAIINQQKIPFLSNTELMKSVEENHIAGVLECLKKGADINIRNAAEETPLQRAIKYGFINMMNILLETGADIKMISSKGDTILHFVATLNASFYSERDTPFNITVCLLQHGAIYNARNKEGKTPLNVSKHSKITILLKKIEACFKCAEDDNTGVFLILQNMSEDEFQAATQACNNKGYTLLQTALFNDDKKIENEILNMLK